jgi:hypothetical protein
VIAKRKGVAVRRGLKEGGVTGRAGDRLPNIHFEEQATLHLELTKTPVSFLEI